MTDSSWEELTSLARAIRAADWFDEQERDYKLDIAPRVRSALELAQSGGDWLARLSEVFQLRNYNLTNFREHLWLGEWASRDPDLGRVLARFLNPELTPIERFAEFAAAAETADVTKGHGASVLAFGSLFNFAVQPEELPIVRARVFESVERHVGWETAGSAAPVDRYEHHLRFAAEARERMEGAGVRIRDMVDVQGVIWVLSQAGDQLRSLANLGHADAVEAWIAGHNGTSSHEDAPVTREAVLTALREFGEIGREAFLDKYGFGGSREYVLVHDGKRYDSKAIYELRMGLTTRTRARLRLAISPVERHSVVRKLERLGFAVRNVRDSDDRFAAVSSRSWSTMWKRGRRSRTAVRRRCGKHSRVSATPSTPRLPSQGGRPWRLHGPLG